MAIDKNAVREGTRWMLRGRDLEVVEVTSRSVIFQHLDEVGSQVIPLDAFAEHASDPALGMHEQLCRVFDGPVEPTLLDCVVAVRHLLERLGPPAPANMAPVIPPKAAPVEAEPVAKVMPAVEDYVVALPHCEPLPEDRPVERKRRFA